MTATAAPQVRDASDQKDILLAIYSENAEHGRHHEEQRSTVSNMVAATAGVVLGFVAFSEGSPATNQPWVFILVATFLIGLGLFGLVACLKHDERAEVHHKHLGEIRKELSQLSGVDLSKIRERAHSEQKMEYPRLYSLQLHRVWETFHVLVILLGTALLVVAILRLPTKAGGAPPQRRTTPTQSSPAAWS